MRRRDWAVQVAVALAVLVAANVAILRMASNSVPRQLLRKAEQAERATDLFLGNSTMAAGLDEAAFAAGAPGRRALNLGMGSSSSVEHYLIFRQQGKHVGSAVYYGFLDRQLTDDPVGGWDTLVGNRAMAYYLEPDVAFPFFERGSPLRGRALRLVGWVPALVERYAIWAKVELMRRHLGEIGMPPKATGQFGRLEDFALLEEDPATFEHRCEQATARRVPLAGPVAALLQLARERGSKAYVVEMPMPPGHRRFYYQSPAWQAYREHVKALVRDAGAIYVPAADWIGEDGFADHLHLDAEGARDFSRRLSQWAPPPE
jgi:hypothetical protein